MAHQYHYHVLGIAAGVQFATIVLVMGLLDDVLYWGIPVAVDAVVTPVCIWQWSKAYLMQHIPSIIATTSAVLLSTLTLIAYGILLTDANNLVYYDRSNKAVDVFFVVMLSLSGKILQLGIPVVDLIRTTIGRPTLTKTTTASVFP